MSEGWRGLNGYYYRRRDFERRGKDEDMRGRKVSIWREIIIVGEGLGSWGLTTRSGEILTARRDAFLLKRTTQS